MSAPEKQGQIRESGSCPKCGAEGKQVDRYWYYDCGSTSENCIHLIHEGANCLRADRDRLQAELDSRRADAELGRMVRGMAGGSSLFHFHTGEWSYHTHKIAGERIADTPEAALEGGKRDE